MKAAWTNEVIGVEKPIIAMCHLNALPGDPHFDAKGGMQAVIDWARKDFLALQNGGVDAVMFSNEFSQPYMVKVDPVTVAAMARVIGELMPDIRIPFGVDVIVDPLRTLDLAAATGAKFIRSVFSGVYASDLGLWDTNGSATVRHKHALGLQDVKMLYTIVLENMAVYLQTRDIVDIARTTVANFEPDALCVSGAAAGSEADIATMKRIKEALPDSVVLANNGVKATNVLEQLKVADGGVVGTTFKYEGKFANHVDQNRVKEFMDIVKRDALILFDQKTLPYMLTPWEGFLFSISFYCH